MVKRKVMVSDTSRANAMIAGALKLATLVQQAGIIKRDRHYDGRKKKGWEK